jgi:hypothetical protein
LAASNVKAPARTHLHDQVDEIHERPGGVCIVWHALRIGVWIACRGAVC